METLKLPEVLSIVAILLSPLVALQVQTWLEHFRAYVRRQNEVLRMLMATRGSRLAATHTDALNRIDMDFIGRRVFLWRFQTKAEKAVIAAWRAYHSHLSQKLPEKTEAAAFSQKREDLYVDLLYAVSQAVGYDFDKTHISTMSYTPQYYQLLEDQATIVREGLSAIFTGTGAFPVNLIVSPDSLKKHEAVQDAIIRQSDKNGVLTIRIVEQGPALEALNGISASPLAAPDTGAAERRSGSSQAQSRSR